MKNVNSSQAYDFIRKRIMNGGYPPGSSLSENMLSADIGVSRTPVRDALRQLQAEGLVTIEPRLGASVKTMDMDEFRDMCGLRLALESHAAGLAALNRTESDMREMGFAIEAMRILTPKTLGAKEDSPVMDELRREDVRFHIAIMTAAGNILMKKEILRLHLINRIVVQPIQHMATIKPAEADARRVAAMASHEEIWRAIKAGDAVAAKAEMERHINNHLQTLSLVGSRREPKPLTEEEMSYAV